VPRSAEECRAVPAVGTRGTRSAAILPQNAARCQRVPRSGRTAAS